MMSKLGALNHIVCVLWAVTAVGSLGAQTGSTANAVNDFGYIAGGQVYVFQLPACPARYAVVQGSVGIRFGDSSGRKLGRGSRGQQSPAGGRILDHDRRFHTCVSLVPRRDAGFGDPRPGLYL